MANGVADSSDEFRDMDFNCEVLVGEDGVKHCCSLPTLGDEGKNAWREILDHQELFTTLEIDDEEFMKLITIE